MIRLTDFPDDILEDVFHAMRDMMCFPGEGERKSEVYPAEQENIHDPAHRTVPLWANLIVLSHVCTHWRRLMLTRPRLWTFLRVTGSFANRMMVNEMLERAGVFPISVLFTHPRYTPAPAHQQYAAHARDVYDLLALASILGDHSERIQELGIVLNSSEQVALVLDTLGRSPVPSLNKLWLDNLTTNSGSGFATARASLLDNAMPPLRVLHAHNISLPWLPYEGLIRLELICGPTPPLAALLHTLRASPQLEVLSLRTATAKADLRRPVRALADEPRAVLPHLRRLQLHAGPRFDAAFSVLPHIVFPARKTAVTLRFDGRVSSTLYEDCGSLEDAAASVRRAAFVLQGPTLASLSASLQNGDDGDATPAPAPTLDPHSAVNINIDINDARRPSLTVQWHLAQDEAYSARTRRHAPRLCEGLKAVPLRALTVLSVDILPFCPAHTPTAQHHDVERFRRLWESVPTVRRLEFGMHPAYAKRVFAALGARARVQEAPVEPEPEPEPEEDGVDDEEEMEGEMEMEMEEGEQEGQFMFGGEEQKGGDEDEDDDDDADWVEGDIVCPELKTLRVNWWERPAVDDLWCVERCCLARASAGARLGCVETVEFPELVLTSLRNHVDQIEVLRGY